MENKAYEPSRISVNLFSRRNSSYLARLSFRIALVILTSLGDLFIIFSNRASVKDVVNVVLEQINVSTLSEALKI